jgi:hypothetical protein
VVVLAFCASLLALEGCTVSAGAQETPPPSKVAEVLERRSGEFDLTRPPDRTEVGMPEGLEYVDYQRDDHQPFHVVFALPEGKRLELDVSLLGFDSYGAAQPATAPPTGADVHHYPATPEAARDHLLAAAAQFGFDPTPVAEWYRQTTGPAPAGSPTLRTLWMTTRIGYLQMSVQARYDWPYDTPESAQVVVHYVLSLQP